MRINKRQVCLLFTLWFTLFLSPTLNAQEDNADDIYYRPQFSIKHSPLSLLAPIPSVDLAIEFETFRNQALQIESGYIFKPKYQETSDYSGFKIATQYRFYYKKSIWSGREKFKNKYIGVQHLYKNIQTDGIAAVWRFNKTYQEIMPFRIDNQSHTFFLLGGNVFDLGKHFYLETEVGLGVKILKVDIKDIPEDAELENISNDNIFTSVRSEGTYDLPGLYWSVRFIYEIL